MAQLDLAIRGGTIVTASDEFRADIGVRDGRAVAVQGDVSMKADIDRLRTLGVDGIITDYPDLFRGQLAVGGEQ